METSADQKWHTLSIQDVATELETDLTAGLSSSQVTERRARFGLNELAERPRPSFLARLWDQLNSFLILILIASAIISGIIGWNAYRTTGEFTEFIDAIAIMAIVALNAVMGLVQEGRAEEALAALKKMAAPNAAVIRNGHQEVVPAP
jgi:Ca2+-transporting ATPase